MFSQFFRLADPVHPDDEREMTGVTGRDPGLRVLEDGRLRDHAIHVEKTGGGPRRESKHTLPTFAARAQCCSAEPGSGGRLPSASRSNSPSLTPSTNASHSASVKYSFGLSGSAEFHIT